MPKVALFLISLCVAAAAFACSNNNASPSTSATLTAAVVPGLASSSHEGLTELRVHDDDSEAFVYVELATTPQQRSTGLMFREEMPEDQGMLFLYSGDHLGAFWMKDTPLPLDIAYLAADGTVLEIHEGVPFSTDSLTPSGPYRNTLEVNRGWFDRAGLGVGSVVDIPDGLPEPQ